jgi:hypothetical protein
VQFKEATENTEVLKLIIKEAAIAVLLFLEFA